LKLRDTSHILKYITRRYNRSGSLLEEQIFLVGSGGEALFMGSDEVYRGEINKDKCQK
jgi:hypothetical protein